MSHIRALAAPFAFKGTLTPADAADAIAGAMHDLGASCRSLPLADGGTGTLDALMTARGGMVRDAPVPGAAYDVGPRRWGMTTTGEAIVEAAEVVALAERDPSILTTLGLGLLIRSALDHNPRSIIIGLGDTATHDCALGVGRVLGYRLLDTLGREITPVGTSLPLLAAIDPGDALRPGPAVPVTLFCDVMNPLTGPDGAARRFAAQKGADDAMIAMLEEGSMHFAEIVRRDLGRDVAAAPGSGAGLMAFLDARAQSGAAAVLDAVGFASAVAGADLVITGEGSLDGKTLLGKGVAKVAEIVASAGRDLLVIAGRIEGERRLGCGIVELGEGDEDITPRARLARAVVAGMKMMGRGE